MKEVDYSDHLATLRGISKISRLSSENTATFRRPLLLQQLLAPAYFFTTQKYNNFSFRKVSKA